MTKYLCPEDRCHEPFRHAAGLFLCPPQQHSVEQTATGIFLQSAHLGDYALSLYSFNPVIFQFNRVSLFFPVTLKTEYWHPFQQQFTD